jgi:hypothetical protein
MGSGDAATTYTIGGLASAMVGPGMAVAIGYALHAPAMVLFSLIPVGFATNALGGAGGPLSVYFVALIASEFGKAVSKETKIDILVTPIVTILVGIGLAYLIAAAMTTGSLVLYFRAILRNRSAYILGLFTAAVYGVNYILIQMETYALLAGSMVLFVLLCLVMHLTADADNSRKSDKQ